MKHCLFLLICSISSMCWSSNLPPGIESAFETIKTERPNLPLTMENVRTADEAVETILNYIKNIHREEQKQAVSLPIIIPLTTIFFHYTSQMSCATTAIQQVNEFLKLLPPLVAPNDDELALKVTEIVNAQVPHLIRKRELAQRDLT